MDARYWEGVGDAYESEIFDSAKMDLRGVVRARLDELADPRSIAGDFGCGVGHYLRLLAPRFRRVLGLDFAESLLRQAAERCRTLDNVALLRADLANPRARPRIPKVDVAVCANVLISDDPARRRNILRAVRRHLAPRARVLVVVPALESALLSNAALVEWNERLGYSRRASLESGIPPTARSARELLQGLVRIDGVPTKHYLREELVSLLQEHGMRATSVDKVEYGWDTEFEKPPRWMTRRSGPWDWLVVAQTT